MALPTHVRRFAAAAALMLTATVAAAEIRRPLSDAAWRVDRDGVRRLLKEGADVNARDGDGGTALLWASYRDDLETVDVLLRAGAQVNAANDLGATALWAASQNGSAAMVGRLLAANADPNLALQSGETALMVASRAGSTAVVSQLVKAGARIDVQATRGQTALMWAVAQRHHAVTKLLIDAGADIHARSSVWNLVMAVTPHGMLQYNRTVPHGSDTALMFAARNGDLESAKLLVAAGANPNDKEAAGITAVAMAAHAGFTDIVEFLLEKGADPNGSEGGFTALHAAIMRRDERMAKALLAHKADPNEPVRMWTPTRRSSRDWNFNPEMVGATPFWLAARAASPSIMRLLADHGANVRVIHHVDYHGGDPPVPRSQTTTPLMAAVGMGGGSVWVPAEASQREALVLESAKLALELGSDINAANDDGRTALDGANQARLAKVVAFLTEQGAKAGQPTNRRPGAPTNRQ
jgi:ankyrin repeat protein